MMGSIPILAAFLSAAALAAAGVPQPGSDVGKALEAIGANRPGAATAGLRKGVEKEFLLEEEAINRWIAEWVRQEAGKSRNKEFKVQSASISLKEGHVVAVSALARLDVSALKALGSEADSIVVRSLKDHLTMDNSMKLEVQISSAKGKIFARVLQARIKDVPLPVSLIAKILQAVGEHQRPPLDFNKMFPLPNGIQRVEVLPGKLRLLVRGL